MSAGLSPITFNRLLQFGRRRTRLKVLRRSAFALLISLLAILAAVSLDALYLLDQWQRWTLSIFVYVVVAACVAWVCKRVFAEMEPLTNIAQAFELVDPRLREQLLSAVELSGNEAIDSASSASFRARLQQQVAKAIQPADVSMLLPWQLIGRSLICASFAVALVIFLSLIPSLHFPQRVARAFFPAANLARHAKCTIDLVRPIPGNQTLATGDVVGIIVRVKGTEPSAVSLHTRSASEEMQTQLMHQSDGRSGSYASRPEPEQHSFFYQSNLEADADWIDYRIVADDASTAWYRITTKPRPRASQFEKRYHFPDYSGATDLVLTEDHGDIEAISGTLVTLTVRADLPIANASLKWQFSDQSQQPDASLPFQLAAHSSSTAGNSASCQFLVEQDRSFRLVLRSAETGFENSFSPIYTIRALPDRSPRIRWSFEPSHITSGSPSTSRLPSGTSDLPTPVDLSQNDSIAKYQLPQALNSSTEQLGIIARPDAIADLGATIEDEFPIAELKQLTRINLRGWSESALDLPTETTANPQWRMDLLPLNLKAGDIVQTKLVAVDRKGQIGETAVFEIVISAGGFDRHRHRAMQLRRLIADALHDFSLQVNNRAVTANQQIKNLPAQSTIEPLVTSLQEEIIALREKIGDVTGQLEDSVSVAELERVGQVLLRIEFEMLPELMHSVTRSSNAAVSPDLQDREELPEQLIDQISKTAQRLDDLFRDFHAHDIQAALSRDLRVLIDVQRDLTERADDLSEEQMRREQAVIGRHFREIERLMIEQLPVLRDDSARQLEQWSLWFANHAEYIEEGTEEHSSKERVQRLAKTVLQQLAQRPQIATIDATLPLRLAEGHKELDQRSGLLFESVRFASEQLRRRAEPSLRAAAENVFDKLVLPRLQQIPARRQLHQLRTDADRFYASDLGNVHRAIKELLKSSPSSAADVPVDLDEIADAFGQLEAIHQVSEASLMLASLLIAERWEISSVSAKTEHPRLWETFTQRVEQAVQDLSRCGIPRELVTEVGGLLSERATELVSQRIASRRWSADQPTSAAAELAQVEAMMREIQNQLALIAARARAKIADYAPSVSQLAQRAAAETRKLKRKTEDTAQALAANEIPQPKEQKHHLMRERAGIEEPISDLRDALADTAGAKDLLVREELQKARDADTGVAIVDEAKRRIDDSLHAAVENLENTESAREKLQSAAAQQQRAADALAQIAEHFEQLDPGALSESDIAKAHQDWQELSKEMNAQDAMKREYSKAEKLSKLADSDPRSLLQQLERELNRNTPMRAELSRIARETAEESIAALEQAAQQERVLNIQLEESDPDFLIKKQLLHSGLASARERAAQIVSTLVSEAKSAATHAPQSQPAPELGAVESRLRQIVSDVQEITLQNSQDEIVDASQALQVALSEARQQLERAAGQLQQASKIAIFESEQELRNRRREMEERQRRVQVLEIRDALQILRSEEQRLNLSDNELRNVQQLQRRSQSQLEKAREELAAEPAQEGLSEKVRSAMYAVESSKRNVESFNTRKEITSERVNRALNDKQQVEARRQSTALNSLNPTAELAAVLAERAARGSANLVDTLSQALRETGSPESLQAGEGHLSSSARDQKAIQSSVAQVGENLARTARHESRLQNPLAASQLKLQAERVSATAETEVREAQQSLEHAASVAQSPSTGAAGKADSQTTAASRGTLLAAESAIRQRVMELEAILMRDSGTSEFEPPTSEEPSSDNDAQQNSDSPIDLARMARMLDELDRQMNSRGSQKNEAGQPAENSSQPTPSSSLAEAVRQLASEMNRGREAKDSQSTQSGPLTSMSRASSSPAPASQVQVMDANRDQAGNWGELREQLADQVNESIRESVAPQYRKQVETYFRVLSEHSVGQDRTLPSANP